MKNSITINVYNLFHLQIDKNNPWANDILSYLGDVPEIVSSTSLAQQSSKLPQIKMVYTPHLSTSDMRDLGQGVFIGQKSVVDRNYGIRLTSTINDEINFQVDNAGLELLVWLMQLSLLKSHATFIHAMGVEINGKSLIFPSWGGVGKTVIAKGFVDNLGWKLLGDDLVILSEDGICYGYPKPMVLYPYHKSVFPSIFEQGKGPIAPMWLNSTLTTTALKVKPFLRTVPSFLQFARQHNPQSTRVKPSEVFGLNSLSTKAQLHTVVWLDRISNISEPLLIPADQSLPSRIFGSTLRELGAAGANLLHIACGLGIISSDDIYPLWMNVLSKSLENTKGWILYIPTDLPVQDVFASVQDTLGDIICV